MPIRTSIQSKNIACSLSLRVLESPGPGIGIGWFVYKDAIERRGGGESHLPGVSA
jgi:hypothetical protein